MGKRWPLMAILLGGLCLALGAEDSKRPVKHPLTDLPPSGQITTAYYFPDHPKKEFPAGDLVKVVVGIHNHASEPYNISAIMGSVNSPMDFSIYLLNFTQRLYFELLPANEELSVEYMFRPDPLLSPREFTIALTLFYEDLKGAIYSSTFFNSTVDIKDQNRLVDTDLVFLYLTIAALIGFAGFLAYQQLGTMGLFKKSKKTTKASTSVADDQDEWIKGTQYDLHKRKKAAKAAKDKAQAS